MPPKAKGPSAGVNLSNASESATSGEAGLDASLAGVPSWLVNGIDLGRPVSSKEMIAVFTQRFPKLTAMLQRAEDKGEMPSLLRVNSLTDGFRRAGIRHPFGVSDYPLDHFDPAQIEIMLDEPALIVELV